MASQEAPSLDAIATGRQASGAHGTPDTPADPESAVPAGTVEDQDSRSTSSASSPLPAEYEESDFYINGNDSESSIGVPGLQDMQVTDDYECLPPVQRLPNEILICIFSKLSVSADLLHVMLTCKRWSRNAVDLLWHRPACTSWKKYEMVCNTLVRQQNYYAYAEFVKRLNLAQLAEQVNDGSVQPLAMCNRVERLTLTGCKGLADTGLIALTTNSTHLMALDISGDFQITEESIKVIAQHCKRLQGLNISNCVRIASDSLVLLAENCKYLKRLKFNDCAQITDDAVLAFAENCPNILEIDLQQCRLVGNAPVTSLLARGQSLRELRLANCDLVDDYAFLTLPSGQTYEHLRILDLTSCFRITDRAVEKIIDAAPRLRNVVLAKCRNVTDQAVFAISRLGKNLHYVHLGHCINLTDEAVKRLVHHCNRIRYIDLGCCTHLTDESVTQLAALPKLKRIGLVKCNNITDVSVYALAKANLRCRKPKDPHGRTAAHYSSGSSLERVHLSYCTQLTLKSIMKLLNSCPRLTHLSLTGVQAFLRHDLDQFCREAPNDFTEHQRQVFCVFSGDGVVRLRNFLHTNEQFAHLRETTPTGHPRHAQNHPGFYEGGPVGSHGQGAPDAGFDEQERDVIDDDDGLDDGSEMMIDAPPALHDPAVDGASLDASMIPPPPPAPPLMPNHTYPWNSQGLHNQGLHNFPGIVGPQPVGALPAYASSAPLPHGVQFLGGQLSGADGSAARSTDPDQSHSADAMDAIPTPAGASTARVGSTSGFGPSTATTSTAQENVASGGHSRDDQGSSSRSSSPEAS